jgi:hypothetical protein
MLRGNTPLKSANTDLPSETILVVLCSGDGLTLLILRDLQETNYDFEASQSDSATW